MPSEDFQHRRSPSRMAAGPRDPWLGVHMLTEFIFCSRAGVTAYEEQKEDEGDEEEKTPNRDYFPPYDPQEIVQCLEKALRNVGSLVVRVVLGLLLASLFAEQIGTLVRIAVFIFFGIPLLKGLKRLVQLLIIRRRSKVAAGQEPDRQSMQRQPIDWWHLLNAGFDVSRYKEPLRDEHWRVSGKPWRVLKRGSLRIPVFLMRRGEDIYRQHEARMAAYCHLIEKCEGAESPYGIILFAKKATSFRYYENKRGEQRKQALGFALYKGVTIPNAPGPRKAFHDGLVKARAEILQASTGHADPPEPMNPKLCWKCHVGKLRWYIPGKTETILNGKKLPPYRATGFFRLISFHSVCGDRFRWLPPHKETLAKNLHVRKSDLRRRSASY